MPIRVTSFPSNFFHNWLYPTCFQVDRLRGVLTEQVQIHGKGNFPTITTSLYAVINCLRRNLREASASPQAIKINGGAASFAVSPDVEFSDLDLIFPMNGDDAESFEKVRGAVFATLSELIPGTANKTRINAETLKDVYVRKMVKVGLKMNDTRENYRCPAKTIDGLSSR